VDTSTLLSLIAVIISLLAAASAVYFSHKQVSMLNSANHGVVLLKLIDEFRDREFHEKYSFVTKELQERYPPSELCSDGHPRGLFDLDETVRGDVLNIAYYFQNWASLVHVELFTEKQLAYMLHVRIVNVWKAIEPYVAADRIKHPEMGNFLSALQKYGDLLEKPEWRMHFPQSSR
jgi:hypothetical protein